MLTPPHVIAVTMMRRNQLIQEADAERLVQKAEAQTTNDPAYYTALAALGRRLSIWGEQLQERYDQQWQLQTEGGDCD